MNTRLGKSFGLAFVVAVGILAVMFALGTFSAPKVGAAATGVPSINPTNPAPSANVQVEVTFENDSTPISNFGEFSIELEGWGLPSQIDTKDVLVRVGSAAANPQNVDVTGGKIVIELNETTNEGIDIPGGGSATVVIRKRAGLTAPAKAGRYDVTVDEATATDAVTVSETLTASPKKGGSGTMITVSGKAFADGTGSLYSRAVSGDDVAAEARKKLANITVSDGAFSVEVDAKDLNKGDQGHSRFEVVDADGETEATAMFQVTGTTAISPKSVDKGKLIKISLSDWIQAVPTVVKIGGVEVTITDKDGEAATVGEPEEGAVTFYVKVGSKVDLGTKTIVLFDGTIRLDSDSVTITSLPLSVVPTNAVAGQEITVEGTGFTGGAAVTNITVGDKQQLELSNGNNLNDENKTRATSGGRVVVTFAVPDGVTDGSNKIQVTDDDGRIGEVDLSVPKPAIALDPATSRRGTTVVVTGSGFPANESIDILYDGNREDSARSSSTGDWQSTLNIPNDADIGGTPDVEGKIIIGDVTYSAKAKHTVPGSQMTLNPETARGGDTVTISGTGFPAYQPVTVKVGVLSEINTGTNTDGNGDFSTAILLPALNVGTHLVQAGVGENSATKVLTVPDREAMPVTRPSADVFEPLSTAGVLTVVWHFDNDTKAWSFYDPRPEVAAAVDLTMVSTGDNVWIQVTADMDFQGEMLTAGWNLVTLD